MKMAKSGQIKNICHPNALMTLCEYAEDYLDESYGYKVHDFIEREASKIQNEKTRSFVLESFKNIKAGQRDLYL